MTFKRIIARIVVWSLESLLWIMAVAGLVGIGMRVWQGCHWVWTRVSAQDAALFAVAISMTGILYIVAHCFVVTVNRLYRWGKRTMNG